MKKVNAQTAPVEAELPLKAVEETCPLQEAERRLKAVETLQLHKFDSTTKTLHEGLCYCMNLKDIINKSGYYRARIIPGQPKTELRDLMDDGTLKIAVNKPPEKGRANKELIKFIAKELNIDKDLVSITSGITARVKLLYIELDRE